MRVVPITLLTWLLLLSPPSARTQQQEADEIRNLRLDRYENFRPSISFTASRYAWVKVEVRDQQQATVARGQAFAEKDRETKIDLDEEHGGLKSGQSYEIALSIGYVGTVPINMVRPVPPLTENVWYALSEKPERVIEVSDVSSPWKPTVVLNRPGRIRLIFDNDDNKIPNYINLENEGKPLGSDLRRQFEVDLRNFPDFTYRFHFDGTADTDSGMRLANWYESFVLRKDTKPELLGLLKLSVDNMNNTEVSFQLSHKIQVGLKFKYGLTLDLEGDGEKPPYSYKKTISLDAQHLLQQLTGVASTPSDGSKGTFEISLVALSGPHANEQIAQISLQNVGNIDASKVISKLSEAKNQTNGADATKTAREALGLQNQDKKSDTPDQAAAVDYIVSILKEKGSNRNKLISLLKLAGNIGLTFLGSPARVP